MGNLRWDSQCISAGDTPPPAHKRSRWRMLEQIFWGAGSIAHISVITPVLLTRCPIPTPQTKQVIVVEDKNGNIVWKTMKDTDTLVYF